MTAPALAAPAPLLSWRPLSVAAVFLVWTALAALVAVSGAIAFRQAGRPVDWTWLVTTRFTDWYTCAVFTPLFVWLARRWPIERAAWPARALLWLAVSSAAVALKYALYVGALGVLLPGLPDRSLGTVIAQNFVFESIAFWCVAGVVHAIVFYERFREREVHAARLRGQLAEARLESLSARLHPHFLFNTLQGISTLIHRDPQAADRMLSRLSDLLRRTLQVGEAQEVPLAEELDTLAAYVAIQQVRFGDRLVVATRVDPAAGTVLVPHFLLQPLVENAIQHGIARRAGAGRIEVAGAVQDGTLRLTVTDDGPGLPRHDDFPAEGVGLGTTRERLAVLYEGRARLSLAPAPHGGLRVEVALPARSAAT